MSKLLRGLGAWWGAKQPGGGCFRTAYSSCCGGSWALSTFSSSSGSGHSGGEWLSGRLPATPILSSSP